MKVSELERELLVFGLALVGAIKMTDHIPDFGEINECVNFSINKSIEEGYLEDLLKV